MELGLQEMGVKRRLAIELREVGAKRPLNRVRKCDGQTNTQKDIRTFRLIESMGPEGRCFEKEFVWYSVQDGICLSTNTGYGLLVSYICLVLFFQEWNLIIINT